MNITTPKTLSGTMELLPKDQIIFNQLKDTIRESYERFGFLPIDTPVIEDAKVLLAKAGGETEKQIYNFTKGDNNICLRFDLTVPLAKYVAKNCNELTFPFKRYQIGKVYRGERPQKGRFREFYQCDIDVVGKEELSLEYDAEIPSIIYSIFNEFNFGPFVININNRKIISGLIESLGLTDKQVEIMRLIDKFEKIGEENIRASLKLDYDVSDEKIEELLSFIKITGTNDEIINQLKNVKINNELFKQGVTELEEVVRLIRLNGLEENYFEINLTIVRGLDYYTGTVYETFLTNYRNLGCVCGGGRYDNLTGYYSKNRFVGVGASIGLTRLFDQIKEMNLLNYKNKSVTKVLVIPMNNEFKENAIKIASTLRNEKISTEINYENTKFKNKLSYADKLNIPYIIILGETEIAENKVTLKNMQTREQFYVTIEEAIKIINS
ncbi:MAG: histidine--tRNA ligase [Christensenellales bacterium]